MQILVSGVAGFIGSFLTEALLLQGYQVYGIDSINDYYDTSIKYARLKNAESFRAPMDKLFLLLFTLLISSSN